MDQLTHACSPAGSILFVPAATALSFKASASGPLTMSVAACNSKVFAAVPATADKEDAAVAEPALVAA